MARILIAAVAGAGLLLAGLGGCPPGAVNPPVDNGNEPSADNTSGAADADAAADTPDAADSPDVLNALPAPTNPAPAAVPGDTILLNEVRFAPRDAAPQFVELRGAAGGSALDGVSLKTSAGESYSLPADAPALGPGELALVVFDGEKRVDGTTIHADRAPFLDAVNGSVALLDAAGAQLDAVAWGETQPDAIALDRGGAAPDSAPLGMTLGRRPESTGSSPAAWSAYAASWATPGAPNHYPSAAGLLPPSGVVRLAGAQTLSWNGFDAASGYRVQIAAEETFAAPLLDETVGAPRLETTLAAGLYFWRVQPLHADGGRADFSPASKLPIRDLIDTNDTGDEPLDPDDATAKTLRSAAADAKPVRKTVSDAFPSYSQRKDTNLLLLESSRTDAGRAWDAPHTAFFRDDPADFYNCTLACVAMIAKYYGGSLSQDRIGYELHKDDLRGPERDLNYGRGNHPQRPLAWALQTSAAVSNATAISETFWRDLVREVNAKRPMILVVWTTSGTHSMTAIGYEIDARVSPATHSVVIMDPGNIGSAAANRTLADVHDLRLAYYCKITGATITARSDEADMQKDADGDGVRDFDEKQRFGTDPAQADTDADCIDDKAEIKRSILDPRHGYARWVNGERSDGLARSRNAPEKTADTDGGGLPDSFEDNDFNGEFDGAKEGDLFDPADDFLHITGAYRSYKDFVEHRDADDHYFSEMVVTCDLRVLPGAKVAGTAHVVHHNVTDYGPRAEPPECPEPFTQQFVMNEIAYDLEVEGELRCKALQVRPATPRAPFENVPAVIHDACRGDQSATATRVQPFSSLLVPLDQKATISRSASRITLHFVEPPNPERPSETRTDWDLVFTR